MFIGRERELNKLESLYETGAFQFPVIYGRRRVGKTALITHFVRKKPVVYFTAVESSAQVNLRNLSRELYAFEHPDANPAAAPLFPDFYAAFEAVFSLAVDRSIVFVIDEFPYLVTAEPGVSSYLQALIDRNRETSKLFLVLCGSSMSFMKEQVLDEKSPLYGRRTAQIELKPFDFFESMLFLRGMKPEDMAQVYGMAGGIPRYLLQFDPGLSLTQNVRKVFLDPNSILYEEPTNLLKQEIQKAPRYNAILAAIADGAAQNNEIATAVSVSSTEITYYLKELQRLGIVEREQPIIDPGRRALYRISDNLFRFWYRFVLPFRSSIERGMPQRAERNVVEHMSDYMGPVFEDICKQWLWREYASDRLDFEFDDIGRWWGADSRLKSEAEIDIVCVAGKEAVAVGECKWRNAAFPKSDLDKLVDRARLVHAANDVRLCAFSKTGFTEACIDAARASSVIDLVDFEFMVNR